MNEYISIAAPIFLSRVFVSFAPKESLKSRALHGTVLATVGTINEFFINYLMSYSFSYSAIASSWAFTQDLTGTSLQARLLSSLSIGLVAKWIIDYNIWQELIPAVFTYYICIANKVPKKINVILPLAATLEQLYFIDKVYVNHYISFGASIALISNNIITSKTLDNQYVSRKEIPLMISIIIGCAISPLEQYILEQLFPISYIEHTYNTLNKLTDPIKLSLQLERNFLVNTNLYLGIGVLDNFVIRSQQHLDSELIFLGSTIDSRSAYINFIPILKFYLTKIAPLYIISRTCVEVFNEFWVAYNIKQIQKDIIQKTTLSESDFINLTKNTKYSIKNYLDDITIIIREVYVMQNELLFAIPKLYLLKGINKNTFISLQAILLIDLFANKLLQYLTVKKQEYFDAANLCSARFEKVIQHDTEHAVTILQKDGLEYTSEEWLALYQCLHSNTYFGNLLNIIVTYSQQFYIWDGLNTVFKGFIALLISQNSIQNPKDEIFLYIRVLQSTVDVLLFKSKHQSNLEKISSSLTRVDNLVNILYVKNNVYKIKYSIEPETYELKLDSFRFIRGDDTKSVSLQINHLILEMGKIYALTGGNGSGKSSFLNLLYNILKNITDNSYKEVVGFIQYPTKSILFIPQKDYCPFNVSLIELITYPTKLNDLNRIQLIKSLIMKFNIDSTHEHSMLNDLDKRNDNWCNILSGGQLKKLFLIKPFLECPDILFLDETFGPIDPDSKQIIFQQIEYSCLSNSLVMIISHEERFELNEQKSLIAPFFDFELHISNGTTMLISHDID